MCLTVDSEQERIVGTKWIAHSRGVHRSLEVWFNGRVVLSTPYVFGYEQVAYALLKYPQTCANPEHTMWFCPATIMRLAELSGLRVSDTEMIRDDREATGFGAYSWALRASRLVRHLPERASGRTMVCVLVPRHPDDHV